MSVASWDGSWGGRGEAASENTSKRTNRFHAQAVQYFGRCYRLTEEDQEIQNSMSSKGNIVRSHPLAVLPSQLKRPQRSISNLQYHAVLFSDRILTNVLTQSIARTRA